jgi:uncharacterized protein YlxP (DUF503 family)
MKDPVPGPTPRTFGAGPGTGHIAQRQDGVDPVFIGSLTADLLLGDVHSLKGKRAVVRPIVAELRRRFAVSAAEVGDQDLHRRALVGVATVAGDAGQITDVLDACERLLAERPEVTLLSTHRQLLSDTDD